MQPFFPFYSRPIRQLGDPNKASYVFSYLASHNNAQDTPYVDAGKTQFPTYVSPCLNVGKLVGFSAFTEAFDMPPDTLLLPAYPNRLTNHGGC